MKKSKLFCILLAAVTVFSTVAFALAANAAGIAKADNVVFLADAGDDAAAGTAAAPVKTMAKAVEKLASTGGVIVVEGQVTINKTNCVMPENAKPITVTSYYDGVDYSQKTYGSDKTSARFIMSNGTTALDLYGDYVFDYITIAVTEEEKTAFSRRTTTASPWVPMPTWYLKTLTEPSGMI